MKSLIPVLRMVRKVARYILGTRVTEAAENRFNLQMMNEGKL